MELICVGLPHAKLPSHSNKLHAASSQNLRAAERIFVDETRAPVLDHSLDPGAEADQDRLLLVSDDRGHGGPSPPIVLFDYAPGRGGVHTETFLSGYGGRFLQCDGYEGYVRLIGIEWGRAGGRSVGAGAQLVPCPPPSGLTRFLEDGRLQLDTNLVENQIRPLALTRKNALYWPAMRSVPKTERCWPPLSPPAG